MIRALFRLFARRKTATALALLVPPVVWFGAVYLAPLGVLFEKSLHGLDDFTAQLTEERTWANYASLFTSAAHRDILVRTVAMALAVTLASVFVAVPYAYFVTRQKNRRLALVLFVVVMLPLWSSYLVRVHGLRVLLAQDGLVYWLAAKLHLRLALDALLAVEAIGGPTLASSSLGMFLVFLYMWLPYMILPVQAAMERVPRSCVEAALDLGARPFTAFRTVVFPLCMPGIAAGSIFTFSLTLGDYIIPSVVGSPGYFIGQMVYVQQGTAGNIPLAATFSVVPVVVMLVYLSVVRRLGAFDAL